MKKKDPLRRYHLSKAMRHALFHAKSGDEGYATPQNHDMPASRFLSYQHHAVIKALRRRKLIKATRNKDFPWALSKIGKGVARKIVVVMIKQEAMLV